MFGGMGTSLYKRTVSRSLSDTDTAAMSTVCPSDINRTFPLSHLFESMRFHAGGSRK